MISALFGEAGLLGALLGALATIASDWLQARQRDQDIRELTIAERTTRQLQEILHAARRADQIRDDVRAGGYHDAVDRL